MINVSSTSPFPINFTSIQDNAIISELQTFITCSRSGMLEGVPGEGLHEVTQQGVSYEGLKFKKCSHFHDAGEAFCTPQ